MDNMLDDVLDNVLDNVLDDVTYPSAMPITLYTPPMSKATSGIHHPRHLAIKTIKWCVGLVRMIE